MTVLKTRFPAYYRAFVVRDTRVRDNVNNRKGYFMIDELCTKPLLNLLREAMSRGIITGWSVDGRNVVLYRPGNRLEVLPLEAGLMLRQWLVQAAT